MSSLNILNQLEVSKLEDIPFANINLIQTLTEEDKERILDKTPWAVYFDRAEEEVDKYSEVSFYLKDGTLIQNVVDQTYITETPQGRFTKKGKSIKQKISELGLWGKIESIIYFTQIYREQNETVISNSKAVSIFNFA